MSIRLATPADLARLVDIYNQAIKVGYRTADIETLGVEERNNWFAEHPANKYPIFVAEEVDLIVGYLVISAYRNGRMALRHTAEISFYVDFEHHRQGHASLLLQHALELCPSLEIRNLFAILMETNIGSIELLKKSGFEQWGHLPLVANFDGTEIGQLYYGRRIQQDLL